jgi:deazaflavin-dependent oxidoreductase (nitroreductase family)
MNKPFQMTRAMRIGTVILRFLLAAGVPMGPLQLLSHRGRKTGTLYTTPVALVERNGTRWLVAAFGEVNWVHNIRATGTAQLSGGWRKETIQVCELGSKEAAPVLKQFIKLYRLVPFIPPYFKAKAQSPLTDFEQDALYHPVFRIDQKQIK